LPTSEPALYSLCALVFLGLGGFALAPVARADTLRAAMSLWPRFFVGFVAYAIVWSCAWFAFQNTFGEILGSFVGLLALTAALARPSGLIAATAVVFLWHTLGYYTGGMAYQTLQGRGTLAVDLPFARDTVVVLARFSWGLCYGLGLGYGLVSLFRRKED